MNMAIVGQEGVQVRKDTQCIRCVDVVQNAVDEDEIEALSRFNRILRHIRDNEGTFVALARIFDVPLIEVNPKILVVCKVCSICTWSTPYIQHPPYFSYVVVAKARLQLLVGKGGLPQPIYGRMFENSSNRAHCFHLTARRFAILARHRRTQPLEGSPHHTLSEPWS